MQARAGVGADHRPDLRDPLRLAAEQLAAARDQLGGALGRLDVLDDPAVGALVAAAAHVVDHPLEGARREVRTRSTGVISASSERIGLTFSAPPTQACARPMRPPRWR